MHHTERQALNYDQPRSMRFEEVRAARRAMLDLPHIKPLAEFAADIRLRHGVEVPEFDPLDGGVGASMLFLFEKPGPMTSDVKIGRTGSGFISRDNDDPTAEATHQFMKAAGIPRAETITWNVVPGWNGTRKITADELREGVAEVERLVMLLPRLRVVVLVGKKAGRAAPLLRSSGLLLFESAHPSPLVRASRPDEWASIPSIWAKAAEAC